jgi:hypothetical protein
VLGDILAELFIYWAAPVLNDYPYAYPATAPELAAFISKVLKPVVIVSTILLLACVAAEEASIGIYLKAFLTTPKNLELNKLFNIFLMPPIAAIAKFKVITLLAIPLLPDKASIILFIAFNTKVRASTAPFKISLLASPIVNSCQAVVNLANLASMLSRVLSNYC